MANVISMAHVNAKSGGGTNLPPFLQKEELAAQIVAIMQAKFNRPGKEEMLAILKLAEEQVLGLL